MPTSPTSVEILLVEDNPRDAELTQRALRQHKISNNILHVKDGAEALDWLFASGVHAGTPPDPRPKVVLLDLKLPKIDGLEVLRTIRADDRTRRIPVVVLSSSREEKDLKRCYELGVNSYIVKPVEFESFSRAIAEAGHYWLSINQESQ